MIKSIFTNLGTKMEEYPMRNILKLGWKEKFVMFLFVLSSANPYLREHSQNITILFLVLIIALYPNVLILHISRDFRPVLIIIFFLSFEVFHRFLFDLNNTKTIFRLTGYFIFSYFVVKALSDKFFIAFIKVMYYLSVLSLVFVLGIYFFNGLRGLYNFADRAFHVESIVNPTIIIYTFDSYYYSGQSNVLRNAGFTWEAGAFATYLNIAFFLHVFSSKLRFKNVFQDKTALVFIISIISTISTTGIMALFFQFIILVFLRSDSNKILYIFFLVAAMAFCYISFDFLGEKVTYQLGVAENSQNRFGAALLDLKDIRERPVTGWSRKEEVLFKGKAFTYATHRPNGITNLLRCYGIFYFFFLLFFWYQSFICYFKSINEDKYRFLSYCLLILILILAFSQLILTQLLFLSFIFIFSIYTIPKRNF